MTSPLSDRETSRYAILGMVWAVISLATPLPFVPSIVALLYCRSAKRHILGSGRYKGQELTQAARSLALFTLWLWILLVVAAGMTAVLVLVFQR